MSLSYHCILQLWSCKGSECCVKKLTRQEYVDLVASLYLYEFGHDNYSGSHCQILEVAGTYSYCDIIFT